MWTLSFIGSTLATLGALVIAYVFALFEKRADFVSWLRLAGFVAVVAGYTGYRAFW